MTQDVLTSSGLSGHGPSVAGGRASFPALHGGRTGL